MSLFRLDASIRIEGSASRALADIVEEHWRAPAGDPTVRRRDIGLAPLPSDAWPAAPSGWPLPEAARTAPQRSAVDLATALVDELAGAEAFLFAVPLYNYGVSQHFKTYVDLAGTDPRMAAESPAATAGKPAVLVTVQGGNYSPGTPKEGWDHATAWMRRILEDVWCLDLEVVSREFTLVGENPALDPFLEMAQQIRAEAEEEARTIARRLTA